MAVQTFDLFEAYFEYREETEPSAVFHRWALIGCIAAWLGRSVWLPFGSSRIFPNHYIMLIGNPGSRKSTAIFQGVKILEACGYSTFSADKTKKEKFLIDLSGQEFDTSPKRMNGHSADDILSQISVLDINDGIPKEVFINADEFNDFMGNADMEFQSLLGRLWDWDKEEPYKHRLKNSKDVSIYQPTINILSGNTPQGFADCFPLASIGQGFMSRLILVHGEPSGKKFPDPPAPDQKQGERIMVWMYKMKEKCNGAMTKTQEAADALSMIYHSWPDLEDTRFLHYSTRRYTHLLKLSMVIACSRHSMEITKQDVVRANTVLAYTELNMPKAIGELGTSRASAASNKLMQYLYEAKEPKDQHTLYKVVRNDLERPTDIISILENLKMADKIQVITLPDSGKQGYLPKRDSINRRVIFIDQSYLKGKELL